MAFDLNTEKPLMYRALIAALTTNNLRDQFYNADLGNEVYIHGSRGEPATAPKNDSPDKNTLFNILQSLTAEIPEYATPPVRTWQDFCALAVQTYEQYKD